MRTPLLAGLTLTLLSTPAFAQAPQSDFPTARVAFFNTERVASESVIGQAGIARLEEFRRSKDQEAQQKNRQLQDAREALRQAASVLSPEVRRNRERSVGNFELDLQRFMEDAQAEFLGVQREVEGDFFVKLGKVITGVARDKNVHFVFSSPSPALFFADERYDLTDDVITRLDELAND